LCVGHGAFWPETAQTYSEKHPHNAKEMP
jgi:hypothetical protein